MWERHLKLHKHFVKNKIKRFGAVFTSYHLLKGIEGNKLIKYQRFYDDNETFVAWKIKETGIFIRNINSFVKYASNRFQIAAFHKKTFRFHIKFCSEILYMEN